MKITSMHLVRVFNGGTSQFPRRTLTLVLGLGLALSFNQATAAGSGTLTNAEPHALLKLSVEELMSVMVTSVSKKAEKLTGTPAAITVISGDDIRRSGVTTIPDALRLAPGVQVARVDAHQWAVSVRGFNDTFSQKLLVMMDGRSVYTPLFSGVIWMAQDTMLEDVDRIEVIRGPGGTVWGANAVNGVISVVSKSAEETQGLLFTGGAGSAEKGQAAVRYGEKLGENTYLRVYGKYADWDDFPLVGSGVNNDAWWHAQGGFRLDHKPSAVNAFTLQGDFFSLDADTSVPQVQPVPPGNTSLNAHWAQQGGNLLGRWTHTISDTSELSVQTYYDYTEINYALLDQKLHTIDLDVRHRFNLGSRQEIVWGGGYRLNASELRESSGVKFSNRERNDQLANLFAQDEITLVPERLRLTLGSKVEHNDYTGFEYEPSARFSWTPHERHTVWAAVSRAVRTPSQFENDARVNLSALPPNPLMPLPTLVVIAGNKDFVSEKLIAYEAGYRVQPHDKLSLDIAGFVNSYDDLRGTSDSMDLSTAPLGYAQLVSQFANNSSGKVYGGELSVTWQATEWWRLYAGYSLVETDLRAPANALTGAPKDASAAASSPQNQFSTRSSMALGRDVDLDVWFRWVDKIDSSGVVVPGVIQPSESIPSYATVDVRLAWRPVKTWSCPSLAKTCLKAATGNSTPRSSTQNLRKSRAAFLES